MNISSAVINVLPEQAERLADDLNNSGLCEVHLQQNGQLVVTIEGNDAGEEMGKLRAIERLPHVLSARLIYTYSEEELDKERLRLAAEPDLPQWLNDDNITAESIRYNGDLRKK